MKMGTNIHGPPRMKPTDVGNPLAFNLAPPVAQSLHLSSEISQRPLDGLAHIYPNIHGSQMM